MREWPLFVCRVIPAAFLALFGLISAGHAEDGPPWLEGISRARPTLDPYGNEAFEMTNTRYGRFEIYSPDRVGVSPAIFEEVTTRSEPGGPTVVAHTRLRVWRYDQKKPKIGDPLYTIDVDCDEGRFISDPFVPEFYELTCGTGFDYRFRRLYRASNGDFVGEADYNSVAIGISSENQLRSVWVTIRVPGYPMPHYDHPPYPVALLTFMTRDSVLDRVVVAHDNLDHAETMAAIADSWHKLEFASVGGLAMLLDRVSETDLASVRLVYTVRSDIFERLLIPLTAKGLEIERAELPKGFTLIRVAPVGNLDHGFVTPQLRNPN